MIELMFFRKQQTGLKRENHFFLLRDESSYRMAEVVGVAIDTNPQDTLARYTPEQLWGEAHPLSEREGTRLWVLLQGRQETIEEINLAAIDNIATLAHARFVLAVLARRLLRQERELEDLRREVNRMDEGAS